MTLAQASIWPGGLKEGTCTSPQSLVSVGSVGRAVALSPQGAPGPLCHLPRGFHAGGLAWGGVGPADGRSPATQMRLLTPSSPDFYLDLLFPQHLLPLELNVVQRLSSL